MYACPMDLSPRKLFQDAKSMNLKKESKRRQGSFDLKVHPERMFRRVSQSRLISRLGISRYDMDDFSIKQINAMDVRIPLSQHLGQPAVPVVKKGQAVRIGDLLGEIPESSRVGARIHSSIDGTVSSIEKDSIRVISN
jgi:Na+-translocating ferredoxin:NAD+ oxidoreductase RnfC subunit